MKIKLAVAFAVLLFAVRAHADGISTDSGVVFIPDGSTINSIQNLGYQPFGYDESIVSFTFADGTGTASAYGGLGAGGTLDFTNPVSDPSFEWEGLTFSASDNVGDSFSSYPSFDTSGTVTWQGPGITSMQWISANEGGGIASLDPTPNSQSVPEPSSLLLSGIGLAALIGLAHRARIAGQFWPAN